MSSLLVMVPTRGRKELCEQLLESYEKTTSFADIIFILDPDDTGTYEGIDWKGAAHTVMDPRGSTVEKLNEAALFFAGDYDALLFTSDDNVFRTEDWDGILMSRLNEKMGGTGWIYPENHRRRDIPEHYLMSTDMVKALGWFANPYVKHYYMDNSVAELGKRTGLLRFCPDVVIDHLHYTVAGTERDKTYSHAEETWGDRDLKAFLAWRDEVMPREAALLRRQFTPDVKWIRERC